MKRLFLLWGLFALPLLVAGQCTPDPNACTPAAAGLPGCLMPAVADTAYVGQPYDRVVQLNFLRFAPAPPNPLGIQRVFISRLVLNEVLKLPPGLSVVLNSGNPADDVNGRDRGTFVAPNTDTPIFGCARFTGTPTTANAPTDSVEFLFSAFVRVVLNDQVSPTEIDPNTIVPGFNPVTYAYRMPVAEPQSRRKAFEWNLCVQPNPVSGTLNLNLGRPLVEAAEAVLVDATGRTLSTWTLATGQVLTELDATSIPTGIYDLQLKQGSRLLGRERVVVLR
jgi:hypothetical protein